MKDAEQIDKEIGEKKAERLSLESEQREDELQIRNAITAYNERSNRRKARAHHLEGAIETLTSLLESPTTED